MQDKGDWKDYINKSITEEYNKDTHFKWYETLPVFLISGFVFYIGIFSNWSEKGTPLDIFLLIIGSLSGVVCIIYLVFLIVSLDDKPDLLE